MPAKSIAILAFAVLALPSVLCQNEASVASEHNKVRQEFLGKYAKGPSFTWLKRKAIEARKKKLAQHKRTNAQEPSDVLKRAKALEDNGANVTDAAASILAQNKPLSDFLYQGDLLLSETDAVRLNFTDPLKQRRAGGSITWDGHTLEIPKWPHDTPICYRFEDGSDEFTMLTARKAFQFWTENSCLTWQEGCVSQPTVKITTTGVGCFTTPGRAYPGGVRIQPAYGSNEEKILPIFDGEQRMSLGAPGCSWFNIAAHEASHVMGMRHEQARPDRDQYIDIMWSNIEDNWKRQYDKQVTSQTLGIPYDYGSNMQYTGYANDPKIDMLAKDKRYQHTMGNPVGPIFNDIKFVNLYNDCMCKSGAKCENGGFPHPRDCSKCVCPEGFGGRTCMERQQGRPQPCGIPFTGNGKRVMLKIDSVTPGKYECNNACTFGAVEVKYENLTMGGARVCCPQHAEEFGAAVSSSDMIIVRVCSLRDTQAADIRFRTVDDYGPPDSLVVVSQGHVIPAL